MRDIVVAAVSTAVSVISKGQNEVVRLPAASGAGGQRHCKDQQEDEWLVRCHFCALLVLQGLRQKRAAHQVSRIYLPLLLMVH